MSRTSRPRSLLAVSAAASIAVGLFACGDGTFPNALPIYDADLGEIDADSLNPADSAPPADASDAGPALDASDGGPHDGGDSGPHDGGDSGPHDGGDSGPHDGGDAATDH